MSRSGYSDDDYGNGSFAMWRGAVRSAVNGKRGQAALKELLVALDAMPEKKLAAESLVTVEGDFCTLGVLGSARGVELTALDPEDWDSVANAFDLAPAMVREIVYVNDEELNELKWIDVEVCGPMKPWMRHNQRVAVPIENLPQLRWGHMRDWVVRNLKAKEPLSRRD